MTANQAEKDFEHALQWLLLQAPECELKTAAEGSIRGFVARLQRQTADRPAGGTTQKPSNGSSRTVVGRPAG
jgi:hypothetical protein